jgi:hypothetical protein
MSTAPLFWLVIIFYFPQKSAYFGLFRAYFQVSKMDKKRLNDYSEHSSEHPLFPGTAWYHSGTRE